MRLSAAQIERAKAVDGTRKRITHALLCGPCGQFFGTEADCRRYFEAWRPGRDLFPNLFRRAVEVEHHKIDDFASTFDLFSKVFEAGERKKL